MGLPFSRSIYSIRTSVRAFPFGWALNWVNFSGVRVWVHGRRHSCHFYIYANFMVRSFSRRFVRGLYSTRAPETQHSICFNLARWWRRNFRLRPYATHCLHIGICYAFHTLHNGKKRGTRAHAHAKLSLPEDRRPEREKTEREKKSNDFMDVNYLSLLLCRRRNTKMTRKWVFDTQITCVHIVCFGPECGARRSGAAEDNKKWLLIA